MANTNAPNGFTPVKHLSGGDIRADERKIASGSSTAIYNGDLVKLLTTGYIDVAAAGDTGIIGVFQGVQFTDANGSPQFLPYWPAAQTTLGSADAKAFVFTDPHIVYEAQGTTGTSLTQAMVGANADITATTGNTLTKRSKHSIDLSTVASGTAQVRILELAPGSELGDAARVLCIINEHQLRSTSGI